MKKLFFVLLVLSFFGVQNVGALTIQSSFDSSDEGWTLDGGNLTWAVSGGNPGGLIIAEDVINTTMEISAPSKFLGNLQAFDSGTISFDAIEMENTLEPWHSFGTVTITSGAVSVSKDLAPDPLPWVWTNYSATLSASEWGVSDSEWNSILSNVTELIINLESGMWVGAETVGVDNIKLTSTTPVPEPATMPWIPLLLLDN